MTNRRVRRFNPSTLRLLALVATTSVIGPSSGLRAHAQATGLEAGLVSLLNATAVNWNEGDLEGFIAPYGESATYMTKDGPVHRADMRRHYETKYFAAGVERRKLHYEQLAVRPLGDHYALMTGRYVLDGGVAPPQTGWFTLVWNETPEGWHILHDHSS
jgi:ketosteroid isomerase-like protein